MKELVNIQSKLKAPKDLYNSFGRYRYRSAESILLAVKPLLHEEKCTLTLSDEVVAVGNRIYIKATATLKNSAGEAESVTAYAREDDTKKGMDASQVTGASSSYARKYALNGLFAIDDTKDADALNTSPAAPQNTQPLPSAPRNPQPQQPAPQPQPVDALELFAKVTKCTTGTQLLALFNTLSPADQQEYKALFSQRKKQLK